MSSPAYNLERIITLTLDLGTQIQRCGGEIYRVEETIQRICHSYGFVRVDVFSITSYISLSARDQDGHVYTESRHFYNWGVDLDRLEQFCNLSRYICEHTPSEKEFAALLSTVKGRISHPQKQAAIGNLITAAGFCLFFGGSFGDAVVTSIAALVIILMNRYVKNANTNRVVYTVVCSFLAGIVAILICQMGFSLHLDKILIGDIMLLIPGMVIITALRDMLVGDLISGLTRLLEGVLIAVSIAVGYAIAIFFLLR